MNSLHGVYSAYVYIQFVHTHVYMYTRIYTICTYIHVYILHIFIYNTQGTEIKKSSGIRLNYT